jgi:dihydrofolate synthase / folylpolyglutamate synthase
MSMSGLVTSQAEFEIDKISVLHPKGFNMSLDNIKRILNELGNPQENMPPTIHVAGTNGKGSVSAFCRALLEAAGLSVHVHISPHLVNWHERYRMGVKGGRGQLVDDALLAQTVRRVAEVNAGQSITVHEMLTAAMFLLFSEQKADVAIVEVGLGGRFDSTNVIQKPATSVIMPISLDHQAYLGDSVELIAAEKAGIIKRDCPVVIGFQGVDSARDVLVAIAERLRAPHTVFGQDFSAHEEMGRLIYQDEFGLMDLPLPKLKGRHQFANAAAAIRAVKAAGFDLTEQQVEQGLLSVEWPGRLQRLVDGHLVDVAQENAEIWLDGGHNPGAGEVISEMMADLEEREERPLYLISGMLNTKDATGYFRAFTDIAERVFTVPIKGSSAGVDPIALASDAEDAGLPAEPMGSVAEALAEIAKRTAERAIVPRILIGGSLYLVGNVLDENGTPPV